jgi:hypothetical protein
VSGIGGCDGVDCANTDEREKQVMIIKRKWTLWDSISIL